MGHVKRARSFLTDSERAGWHDSALWLVRAKRDRAADRVDDWEALRDEAARVKREALSRLPELWSEFETRATEAGARVHWARDANEHNRIVAKLLRDRGLRRVVKSKSMLTEECRLNDHLERQGIEVVDTDLGERIVQLRHEPPSHIVMPAIHLRRAEVGALFHREMGSPADLDDPDELTRVARRDLRGRFLEAEAGLTGMNFAVAETGSFVIVTNEGNADLGTALPRLHIASVGLEKIVPRARDLAPFLRLLARSATGQAISSYTSHFRGPGPDDDGARELHIVVVDNGRSRLLARPAQREALACIRCGACLNTCLRGDDPGADRLRARAESRSRGAPRAAPRVQPLRVLQRRLPRPDPAPPSAPCLARRAVGDGSCFAHPAAGLRPRAPRAGPRVALSPRNRDRAPTPATTATPPAREADPSLVARTRAPADSSAELPGASPRPTARGGRGMSEARDAIFAALREAPHFPAQPPARLRPPAMPEDPIAILRARITEAGGHLASRAAGRVGRRTRPMTSHPSSSA
jgi:iron-sulfur cluster protein